MEAPGSRPLLLMHLSSILSSLSQPRAPNIPMVAFEDGHLLGHRGSHAFVAVQHLSSAHSSIPPLSSRNGVPSVLPGMKCRVAVALGAFTFHQAEGTGKNLPKPIQKTQLSLNISVAQGK